MRLKLMAIVLLAVLPAACAENTEEDLREAASRITPDGALQHLSVLASDDMMGRDTDTPEIWEAARYIAGEFQALGLEPLDEDGDFIQEYGIAVPEMDCAEVRMVVEGQGGTLELQCGQDFAVGPRLNMPTLDSLAFSPLREHGWYREHEDSIPDGSLVLTTQPTMQDLTDMLQFGSWMQNVWDAGANAIGMVLPPMVTREMMPMVAAQVGAEPTLSGPPMFLMLTATMNRLFELAGVPTPNEGTLDRLHRAELRISIYAPTTTRTISAPNVVARLPGSGDSELKDVVITAHFDHEPPGPANAEGDSIFNGADDNASGTVGLLEAARAFAALPIAPERSIVFAAVSAEEMGLLGSAHIAEHGPAPATSTAAALNMDMLSRNAPDSLFVFGQTYSSLGETFQNVMDDHPELGFQVRPGLQWPEIDLIRFSDQASYLERGVPVLFFNSGFHPELHTPDDEVEIVDGEKLARASRLMFYLAYAIANDRADPRWTPEGRARTVGMQSHLGR